MFLIRLSNPEFIGRKQHDSNDTLYKPKRKNLHTFDILFHFFAISNCAVPRKVLKEQFDERVEPDEPQQIDMDQNQDDLYDEDQFYRESEAIPPAPKLHRELATSDMPTSLGEPSSSVNPPLRSRDSNQLEGELNICFSE